ncbi:MAG: peptidylprolyl isomerase [Pseudomonadota bacterium]
MTLLRSSLTVACLAALSCAAGAQGLRPPGGASTGITDIMRAPRFAAPSSILATPSGPAVQRPAEFIVALVNSEPITNTEVVTRMERILRENAEAGRMPRNELARLVLERLISERAQLQVARENGIRVDDLTVDQTEESIARQNQFSVAELRRRVSAEGLSQQEFRNDLRNQLLLTRVREREVDSRVKISDVEVDQFILDQRSGTNAAAPRQLNLAQVLIGVPENATEAQITALQQKAQQVSQRARSGEDFGKLVREFSDAPDKASGGVLGLRSADRYPPLFVDATQSVALNGVTGPIRSEAGFHVLKVLAKGEAGAADGMVVQTQARHILLRTDAKRSTEQAVAELAEFKRRIQSGTADFAGLARDNSQDASAKGGGDLGWTRAGQFVPEFEEVLDRLAPGQVSDPVVTRFGVHLIQVMARRETKLSQAEQREAARAVLREKKAAESYETWAQEVRARAYVEYRDPPQS